MFNTSKHNRQHHSIVGLVDNKTVAVVPRYFIKWVATTPLLHRPTGHVFDCGKLIVSRLISFMKGVMFLALQNSAKSSVNQANLASTAVTGKESNRSIALTKAPPTKCLHKPR